MFKSKKTKLAQHLTGPMNTIALAMGGIVDGSELDDYLSSHRSEIEGLKRPLSEHEVREAYAEFWRGERTVYTPLFETVGVDPDELQALQLHWLLHLELPPAQTQAPVPVPAPAISVGTSGGRELARPIAFPPLDDSTFVFVETVRTTLPRDQDGFAVTERLGQRLLEETGGYGFGGVVRDDRLRPVSPQWIAPTAVDVHGSAIAVAGTISHLALEESRCYTALDLGARDGRNSFEWNENAPTGLAWPHSQLFLGDWRDGWLEMAPIHGNVGMFDFSPDGRTIAMLEWWGGQHVLSLASADSGDRRVLTGLPTLGGGESVRFSHDGQYILLATSPSALVVRVASGEIFRLPVRGHAAWWPAYGPSTVLYIDQSDVDALVARAFDLETLRDVDLGPVRPPWDPRLPSTRKYLAVIDVHPHRNLALVLTSTLDVPVEHLDQHGGRERLFVLNLGDRTFERVTEPFVGSDMTLQREHRSPRWLERASESRPVALSAQLQPISDIEHTPLGEINWQYVARDAHDLLVVTLRAMTGDDPPKTSDWRRFRPEAVRAMVALRTYGPEFLQARSDWLEAIGNAFFGEYFLDNSVLRRQDKEESRKFVEAWERIKDPSRGPIEWYEDRFRRFT